MKQIFALVFALGLLAGFAAPAVAQSQRSTADVLIEGIFSKAEEEIIRQWYEKRWGPGGIESEAKDVDNAPAGKGAKGNKKGGKKGGKKSMPPGLAKRDQLPPGLQKRLDIGEPLPPGLAKRDLPPRLAAELPPRTDQHDVKVIDGDVVLIDKTTDVILDILKDVFTPRHQGQ